MSNLEYIEHESFRLSDKEQLRHLFLDKIRETQEPQSLKDVRLLGMDYRFREDEFRMSYYVGTDWVDAKKRQAMVVMPRRREIDLQTMLMKCFTCDKASEHLDQVFFIRTDDKPIEIDSDIFQIEPLLVVYFLNLISRIVRKGLKSGYMVREERLNGKIKGKVLVTQYLKHGIAANRPELVDCRFHEYNINCVENRIIKRALLLCKQMLIRAQSALGEHITTLQNMYASAVASFEKVSNVVSPQELLHIPVNPVFKEYREALPLAKMIIKKRGYCVEHDSGSNRDKFPPFIIDMRMLFERYVYALLHEAYGDTVGYQTALQRDSTYFIKPNEHLVITTHYTSDWQENMAKEEVWQLLGYARSRRVRRLLGVGDDNTVCTCMMIYPDTSGVTSFRSCDHLRALDNRTEVEEYIAFGNVSVSLPVR